MQSWQHKLRILGCSPAFWLGGSAILAAIAANITASDSATQSKSTVAQETSESRKVMREGARIESVAVRIRVVGETLVFSFDGKEPIEGLENLALHRIFQALQDDPNNDRWIVTGQITEFRERNYLLLEKVVRASESASPQQTGKK